MEIFSTELSTRTRACVDVPAASSAHPNPVGYLAVQGVFGGSRMARPRTTGAPNGAYKINVSTIQFPMAGVRAAAGARASGIPPRGRPV
jgi:hypothetical protein